MEKRLESPALKVRTDELLAFQRELKEEKELLNKMLLKIDDQLHALKVEQLHLLGLMNKSLQSTKKPTHGNPAENKQQEDSTHRTLDLSVPASLSYFDEEIEEDEEEDDM